MVYIVFNRRGAQSFRRGTQSTLFFYFSQRVAEHAKKRHSQARLSCVFISQRRKVRKEQR